MKQMIEGYVHSCKLAKDRIKELTLLKRTLLAEKNEIKIEELDLERRISLLYVELSQMQEIIAHLTSYMRRVEERAQA